MPINVQLIVDRCNALLDAEGSERYLFDQDFKPNINKAMEGLVTIFNQAFAENKLTPEALRELSFTKIWQTNQYSRISYDPADTGHPLWSIFGVYPKIKTNKGVSGIPVSDKSESKFRPDLSFISSEKSAKRLTFEEWNQNVKNAFVAGNALIKGELAEYAYLDFSNYTSTSYTGNPNKVEITIRPDIPGELVAISYLKYPKQVSLITDTIEFPESLTTLMVDMTLEGIAYKQGDGTSLYMVCEANIKRLVSLIK